MYTSENFKEAYKLFLKESSLKPNNFFVKNLDNNREYFIKGVYNDFVIILQGKSEQKHFKKQLEELFITGKLIAPNIKNLIYQSDSNQGHLPMKIAIVHHLKDLLRKLNT